MKGKERSWQHEDRERYRSADDLKRSSEVDTAPPWRMDLATTSRALPGLFAVDVRSVEGETVLTLRGELDMSTQQLFVDALTGVDESVARIVLDLSDLTFIDCGNIGVIHRSRIVAGLRGTFLELRSPNPQLLRIMELTGLLPSANGEQLGPFVLPSPSYAYEHAAV